jgi:transposase
MSQAILSSPASGAPAVRYVVGLDVGSATCLVAVLTPDKRVVRRPFAIANAGDGFTRLDQQLAQLGCAPREMMVGLEATGRYWENVYYFLQQRGSRLVLLHPAQTHHFAERRGLRAKTDQLDAVTIARALLSDDVRPAYVPNELTATYRDLVRLHSNLSDEAARYKNESQDLLVVLFPEFTQIFKDPTRKTALAVLRAYPGAQALAVVGVDPIAAILQATAPRNYGPAMAQQLVALATRSSASPVAVAARTQLSDPGGPTQPYADQHCRVGTGNRAVGATGRRRNWHPERAGIWDQDRRRAARRVGRGGTVSAE